MPEESVTLKEYFEALRAADQTALIAAVASVKEAVEKKQAADDLRSKTMGDKLDTVISRLDGMGGQGAGIDKSRTVIIQAVVFIGGIITILAAILGAAIYVASRK